MNGFLSFAELALVDYGFGLAPLLATALYVAALLLATRHSIEPGSPQATPANWEDRRLRALECLLDDDAVHGRALEYVVDYVEAGSDARRRIHCCVLLLEPDGRLLQLAAAHSLPAAVQLALRGATLDELVGPSAAASWHAEPVLVPDILAHPDHGPLRPAAKMAALRSCWTAPVRDAAGRPLGVIAAFGTRPGLPEDAELRRLREASLMAGIELARRQCSATLLAQARDLGTLVDRSPDSIARYDVNCCAIRVNAQLVREAGLPASQLLGRAPSEFPGGPSARAYEACIAKVLATGRADEFELDWVNAAGELRHSHIRLEPEHDLDGRVTRVLAVGRDVTRLVEYRKKLHELAYVDALTGLPNRAWLKDLLRASVADAAQHGRTATLIVLGLDRFKAVNDTFGRHSGDALLRAASKRLCQAVAPGCVTARLEGDQFAILLPAGEPAREDDASPAILDALAAPFQMGSLEIRLTASLGIAHAPDHGVEAEELLRCATMALHHAKVEGRNRGRRYAPELTAAAQERLALEADLRKGLAAGEFELHYQPKVELCTGSLVGAEALIRWRHPQRGLIMPGEFISLAEESGLIAELGEWALRTTCRAARRWNEQTGRHCPVAVNLSPHQFIDGRLADRVQRALAETGCRPEWIELEITESLLLDDHPEIRQALEVLDGIGMALAVDDFGTGYSALAYLARFPIRTLKIDRSFVAGVLRDRDSAELVRAIAAMARSLRMALVAEGVENLEQADFLKDVGCRVAQGYLYGKPMSESVFESLLLAPPAVRGLLEQAD